MVDTEPSARRLPAPWLFGLAVFVSATLVFMVEPMMARLILPVLGGSSAVWNASLAFFQATLLVGYLYAHGLQRIRALRWQVAIHLTVLAVAAVSLPLVISPIAGDPDPARPVFWLMGALLLSVGAPFAALSATAPLLQAWHARALPGDETAGPWGLYAVSNLGSLLALLAYPAVVEPLMSLRLQAVVWSVGYAGFAAIALSLGVVLWRQNPVKANAAEATASPPTWIERGRWVTLAAIPSSLMLGVTTYVTTDVGSAPFLWVAPLALYLATFIVAFQPRPLISSRLALVLGAGTMVSACALIRPMPGAFLFGLAVHFANFFFAALICHQALVARRPESARLTDFYICMSLGGVIGGAYNAFLAPAMFATVVEYPAMLVLACLARPWRHGGLRRPLSWGLVTACAVVIGASIMIGHPVGNGMLSWVGAFGPGGEERLIAGLIATGALLGLLLARDGRLFALVAMVLAFGAAAAVDHVDVVRTWRGFYGVLRESRLVDPRLGGEVRMLAHGTTLHGAQAQSPTYRCTPLVYYAHETPIGQVFQAEQAAKPRLEVGAVGMGTGSVAAYDRAADHFTFFEIDPLVVRIAADRRNFSYLGECARGRVDYRLGDARLTLHRQPPGGFDILLIDAFSSDSVPAHLLTVEAARLYMSRIKPDGVVILHLSNRNLDLVRPAQALAASTGASGLFQAHFANRALPAMWESSEDALILARTPAGLSPFIRDPRWRPLNAQGVPAWTDDHTDLIGALVRRLRDPSSGKR